jgi:hypothetical protein
VILSETVRPPEKHVPVPPAPITQVTPAPASAIPATPEPATPTETAPEPKKSWGPFSDNISNILSAIKLPERFDAKASGDIKKRAPQEAPEPIIISETVTPASKKPAPAVGHDGPAPMHFANEAPPIVSATPKPTQKSPPVPAPISKTAPAADNVPDVSLPSHKAPTFPPIPTIPRPYTPATNPPSAPAPTPTPVPLGNPAISIPNPVDQPAAAPDDHPNVTPLRTFKEDLMHVVHDRKISLVSAVAMEEDKKRDVKQPTPAEIAILRHRRRRTFAILYTVAILFGLSMAALYGVYTVQNQQATPAPNPNATSIIFAEQTYSFPLQDLSASDIKRTLGQSHNSSNASLGSITRIIPTVKTADGTGARAATTAEFFKAIDLHVSDELVRALSTEFFLGIHTIDKNSMVIIIPVNSYEHAFAGMLAWEPTMNTDLAPAFTPVTEFTTDENGLPERRTFVDVVMRNYDTRALKDDSGAIQLYYSFPTPNVLIISENPFSFTEILSRLQVQRRL